MCGIIGGNLFNNQQSLAVGHHHIMHRGREAHDAICVNGFWIGHNRLSIQNVGDEANQPMWDETGMYCITFNGELWKRSFDSLNEMLRKEYRFKTPNSDTELLLYAYIEFGTKMFDYIDGMFSFAIYDGRIGKILLGRDWAGRLPFYYLHKYGGLAFASEKKVLTEIFSDLSKEVQIVQPSHYYTYDLHTGSLSSTQYYDIEKEIPASDSELDVVKNKLFTLLEDAVDNELISDVPVCTILSGGIDSGSNNLLSKTTSKRLESVCCECRWHYR